eukprot:PITA_02292
MNIRGLGTPQKFLALKIFFFRARPKIVFIQETMHSSRVSIAFFRKMFPSWFMVATEANGLSGGLAGLWDPVWIKAKAFKCCVGIMMSALVRGHAFILNLLNVYAPCRNRSPFWERLFASEILDIDSLLLAGDLNVTLSPDECWGNCRKSDSLSDKLRLGFLSRNLVDVKPDHMKPTWENGRTGQAHIAKRIDRFLIKASVIEKWGMPFSSIANEYSSDHRPIVLEWRELQYRREYYFKFNGIFLEDKSFNDVITNKWMDMKGSASALFSTFREKIQCLKKTAKVWQSQKIKQDKEELLNIQKELDAITSSTFHCMSFEKKIHIRALEKRKHMLLLREEASWRLKSIALWLKEGDRNTKFFHNFANARRRRNSIWKIEDGNGGFLFSQEDISNEAARFFQKQYKRNQSNAGDMLWAADLMPEMFDGSTYENFIKPVTKEELLAIIKSSKKDKSPGPDGWPIEFFLHFYDLFKQDLLGMVEASRMSGNIHSALSSTFIALIPKKKNSKSFQDYRPIALCNSLFKIITKVIAERLKPILNLFITRDQHAFLKDRNIWDAVALTQESLFSLRTYNIKVAILKIDLKKSYDCVDGGLLRILLAKIGLRSKGNEWIMACVENVNFSIIINGIPSPFFKAERGLRQGCPLSPLLFILVMNTLSLHLNKAASELRYRLIKICKDFFLSHNLFMDDILIFAMLCKASWLCLYNILNKFQSASSICINKDKSKLYHNETDMELVIWIASLIGIEAVSIGNGIKYLGFSLKPIGNKKGDWSWLLDRFYKRISGWELRFLSLAGCFILVQAVLSQLAIYWAHLFSLPASIIKKMSTLAANFLWEGKSYQSKFHLVKMNSISKSRKSGGWGLLDLRNFGNALLCKSLLKGIFGSSILIGFDFIKDGMTSPFPPALVSFFHSRGIITWDKLIKSWSNSTPVWKDEADLFLPPHIRSSWSSIRLELQGLAIRCSGSKDVLAWYLPRAPSPACVKDLYAALSLGPEISNQQIFPFSLWKVTCPLKMILFSWLLFRKRNLTWEVLQKKGWQGPGKCALCQNAEEPNFHMFFQCPTSQQIWYELSISLDFPHYGFSSVQDGFFWWSDQMVPRRSMFIMVCWTIWKWRNESIFNCSRRPLSSLLLSIKAYLDSLG